MVGESKTKVSRVIEGATWEVDEARKVSRNGDPLTRRQLLSLPVESDEWRWLRAQGVRRPSPSGTTQPAKVRSAKGRTRVEVWLSSDAIACLDALTESLMTSRREAIERLVLATRRGGKDEGDGKQTSNRKPVA